MTLRTACGVGVRTIKAILYKRPPNQQIMRLAGNIRYLCRKYNSQLFCQTGNEIRRISNGSLLEILHDIIRSFCRPGVTKFFACGQNADDLIDELYEKLLTWDSRMPTQDTDDYGPELLIASAQNRVNKLVFRIKDESVIVNCQLFFSAPEPIAHDIPDGSDTADPKQSAPHFQEALTALKSIEHIVLYGSDFGKKADTASGEQLALFLNREKSNTAVIAFDWPCHGSDQSDSFRLADCSQYLLRLTEYIHTRFNPNAISVYAVGFAANQVLRYIREYKNPFHRIVLRSPILNMYDVLINRILSEENRKDLLKGREVNIGLNRPVSKTQIKALLSEDIALDSFAEYCDDICIIHGTEDEIVPVEHVKTFAAINQIEDTLLIEAADHGLTDPSWDNNAYRKAGAFVFEERSLDMDSQAPIIRERLTFYGKVQDVGFRWRALAFAYDVGATGWVRKDYASTITMEIQSTELRINRVISRLERVASIQIDEVISEIIPVLPGESAFWVAPNETKDELTTAVAKENVACYV